MSPRFNWGPIVVQKEELTRRFRAFGRQRKRAERDISLIKTIDIQRTSTRKEELLMDKDELNRDHSRYAR